MRKITFFAFAISILALFSCERNFPKEQSMWVVQEAEQEDEFISLYRVRSTDMTQLNTSDTWLADSTGKFRVGDTLVFSKVGR